MRAMFRVRKGLAALMAGAVCLLAGSEQAARGASLPTSREINGILRELSAVTGFTIRRQLPFESVTKEQVNEYLKEQIKETVKPDEIKAEEVSLKMLGFVPDDFDLRQTTIDLLTEQAAAFYDFHRRKLFISEWAETNMRDEALIHELAHALADQNFSIRKFMDVKDEGELSLARQAVVEGQASWLMLEVSARRDGKSMADPAIARQALDLESNGDGSDYPVFSKAPLYLRRTLLFPYDAGQRFQQAVFEHDGKAGFARVFSNPPISSAQIEYPDRYFSHELPAEPVLPKALKTVREYAGGSMGALETGILMEQYVGPGFSEDMAPKLKGGTYRIDEDRKTRHRTLVYASEWDSEEAARRFLAAYQDVLREKSKDFELGKRSDDGFSGRNRDGWFAVSRTGRDVLVREGWPTGVN